MTAARSSEPPAGRRLGRAFFDRPTVRVAGELLGSLLTVTTAWERRTVRIVETEAYVSDDPANHAFRGPTARNRSMFQRPGTLYVYRIHQVVCANLVTRPGEAVLLRAAAPVSRGLAATSGPGRLCRALGLSIDDDGVDAVAGSRLELRSRAGRPPRVVRGARIGIRRAVERPLRFAIADDTYVSQPRPGQVRRAFSASASPTRSRAAGSRPRTRRRSRRPSAGGRNAGRIADR